MARGLTFRIEVVEELYYPYGENKGADQLRGYREADLRPCFRICKNPVFSRRGSFDLYRESLLGKALRIDVDNPTDTTPYSIPADNPSWDHIPNTIPRPEIFAYGLGNPLRCGVDSGDPHTGILLPRPLSKDPRYIQFIYHYSHASKRLVEVCMYIVHCF